MTTLTFQNTTLSVINQHNQVWLSASDIAKALGYSRTDLVIRVYDRHQDEFTPNMTALIDMRTNGGMQKVRIFSLRGCHLIGMLSHTKVAKEFRKWVLDILDKETSQPQQLALPEPEPTITVEFKQSEIKNLLAVWFQFTRFAESVYFLLNKVKPFIVGSLYSSAEFNLDRCNKNIRDTKSLIAKLIALLPQDDLDTKSYHRRQVARLKDNSF